MKESKTEPCGKLNFFHVWTIFVFILLTNQVEDVTVSMTNEKLPIILIIISMSQSGLREHSHCPKTRQRQIPITSTKNPMGICFVICFCAIWTSLHNLMQTIFLSVSVSVSVSSSVSRPLVMARFWSQVTFFPSFLPC